MGLLNFLGWAGFEPGPKRFRRQLLMDWAIQADKRLDLDTCLSRASSNPVRSCIEFILSWICLSPMEDTTRHSHLSGILNPIVLWTYLRRLNIPQWLNIYLAICVSYNAFRILSRILQYMKKKIGTVSFRKNFWVERDLNPGPNDSDAGSLWIELYKHTKG